MTPHRSHSSAEPPSGAASPAAHPASPASHPATASPHPAAATPAIPARAVTLLVVLTLVWGTNWPVFPYALAEVSVWTFRAFALPAAGLTLLAVARARGLSLALPREDWPTVVAASFCYLTVWNVASAYAAVLLPSGQAAILGFTMPLWAALLGFVFMGQRLPGRLLAALALGAGAVGLLMWRSLPAYANAPAGFALGLLAAVGWAAGTLILKRRPPSAPALVLTGWQLVLSSVPIVPAAFVLAEGPWFMPSWQSLLAIAYVTWMPMTIGNLAWFSIVGLLPAQVAGLSSVMVPVVAMISGAIVHGEPLGPAQLGAMACSAGALWLALRPARR